MFRIRELQDYSLENYSNGFTSFIAWPVQLENNSYGKRNRGRNKFELGAGPTEYLRHVAISRLFFDNIEHIQASWPTMGLSIAQMALLGGADDAGSTMMEENVVSASGTDKMQATEIELQDAIIREDLCQGEEILATSYLIHPMQNPVCRKCQHLRLLNLRRNKPTKYWLVFPFHHHWYLVAHIPGH